MIVSSESLIGYGLNPADKEMCKNFSWYPIEVDDVPTYCIYFEKPYLKEPEQYGDVFIQKYGIERLSDLEIIDKTVDLKKKISAKIDAETVVNITKGFDHTVNYDNALEKLHFSYDYADQRNFTDTATVIVLILTLMKKGVDVSSMPVNVSWNAYRNYTANASERIMVILDLDNFLDLYIAALKHKLSCLEIGKQQKMYIMNSCNTIDQLILFITSNDIDIQLYNI